MIKAQCQLLGDKVQGMLTFEQDASGGPTKIIGAIKGLSDGPHGFHVHQFGDLSAGCTSAGGHFNPFGKTHGAPTDEKRHVGDLGNVDSKDGSCEIEISDKLVSLIGPNSVIGRAIVVHAKADDLGKGGKPDSLTTGDAGGRVCCGVIGIAK